MNQQGFVNVHTFPVIYKKLSNTVDAIFEHQIKDILLHTIDTNYTISYYT